MKKISIYLLIFAMISFSANCFNDKGETDPDKPQEKTNTRNFIVGIGPVWKNYPVFSEDSIKEMLHQLDQTGEMLLAQSCWKNKNDIASCGQVPDHFNDFIKIWPPYFGIDNYRYVSYGINFFNQQTRDPELSTDIDATNNWTNNDAKIKYQQVAMALCEDYNAQYLALALEVNVYGKAPDGSEEDYNRFVEYYKTLYDAIKAIYPETKIFVTFQLEHMKGLGDTSWGYNIDKHWDLLEAFEGKLDLIAFTTYPEFEYDDPSEIPDDYYSSIISNLPANLKDKPFAFVEIGWSDSKSEQAQVDFLNRFLTLTKDLNIEYTNWVFLHDDSQNPVDERLKVGLKTWAGEKKLVWDSWKVLKDKPYQP